MHMDIYFNALSRLTLISAEYIIAWSELYVESYEKI